MVFKFIHAYDCGQASGLREWFGAHTRRATGFAQSSIDAGWVASHSIQRDSSSASPTPMTTVSSRSRAVWVMAFLQRLRSFGRSSGM